MLRRHKTIKGKKLYNNNAQLIPLFAIFLILMHKKESNFWCQLYQLHISSICVDCNKIV